MTDTNHKRVVSEGMTTHVGIAGGNYTCDMEGCKHFETNSMTKYDEHRANHRVDGGHHRCTECGEFVVFKDLKEEDRPTLQHVKNNLVFHPKCSEKFFKSRGFEVKKL